jgi:hypothetical protein
MADGALEELAAWFVLPSKSGVYLTRNELLALARAADGSLRVSERRRMLADVLKSPQSPQELDALLKRLIEFCRQQREEYQALAVAFPVARPLLQQWLDRVAASVQRLEEVCEELALT